MNANLIQLHLVMSRQCYNKNIQHGIRNSNSLVSIAAFDIKVKLRVDSDGPDKLDFDLGELGLHFQQELLHGGNVGCLPFVPCRKSADFQSTQEKFLLIP